MKIPLEITFKHVDPSEEIQADIQEKVQNLNFFYDRIMDCHVILEVPHQQLQSGQILQVRVVLTLPEKEFVVKRNSGHTQTHESASLVIREVFEIAKRKVQHYIQRRGFQVGFHAICEGNG